MDNVHIRRPRVPRWIISGLTLVAVFAVAGAVYAAIVVLMPVADGTYQQWSVTNGPQHFTNVDDAPCNGTTDYAYTNTLGNRDSYVLNTHLIPPSSTIHAISISPCASHNIPASGTVRLNVFYIFDGVKSVDSGNYEPIGIVPQELAPFTFLGLNHTVHTTSILEVGAIYTSGTLGLRLSNVSTTVTYSPP